VGLQIHEKRWRFRSSFKAEVELCGREHAYHLEYIFQENESAGIINNSFAGFRFLENLFTNNIKLKVLPSTQQTFIN
jgi:hypothetical protein